MSFRLIRTTIACTQLTMRIDPSSKRPAIPSNKVGPDDSLSFVVAHSFAYVHRSVVKLAGCIHWSPFCMRHFYVCSYIGLPCGCSDALVQSGFIDLPSQYHYAPYFPTTHPYLLATRLSYLLVYTISFLLNCFLCRLRDVSYFY